MLNLTRSDTELVSILSDKAKINRAHLALIEKGKANPTIKILGVKVKDFF